MGQQQVIPPWFVAETAAPTHHVTTPELRWKLNPLVFSHGWELPARLRGESGRCGEGLPADTRSKPGSGGQLIACIPSLDLVVTRQTGSSGDWEFEEYLRRACAALLPPAPTAAPAPPGEPNVSYHFHLKEGRLDPGGIGAKEGRLDPGGIEAKESRLDPGGIEAKESRLDPGGIEAISRWLSVSDTTGNNGMKTAHPEGVTECGREKQALPSGIPAGMPGLCLGCSGDVAALNPRLMASIPPGSCGPFCRKHHLLLLADDLLLLAKDLLFSAKHHLFRKEWIRQAHQMDFCCKRMVWESPEMVSETKRIHSFEKEGIPEDLTKTSQNQEYSNIPPVKSRPRRPAIYGDCEMLITGVRPYR